MMLLIMSLFVRMKLLDEYSITTVSGHVFKMWAIKGDPVGG